MDAKTAKGSRPPEGPEGFRPVDVTRVRSDQRTAAVDRAATEEPLEVRLHGEPFAVIMRTPGADRELAAGFLLSERVVRGADDLGAIEYCADADAGNVVNVTLAIDLARESGVTLAGFVRGDSFNIYAHPARIVNRD